MQVEVSLLHGRRGNSADGGVRFATGECQVTPDNIHDYWVRETGLIKICSPGFNLGNAEVKISLDELRTIIATLRKRGIEIDD
jgi:hypothetical protein